jgi:hypothetical protein
MMNHKEKILFKQKVESLIRERGATGDIVWRDNRASTYQGVYEFLMKYPEGTLEDFGVYKPSARIEL